MKKKDELWWLVVAEGVVAVLLGIYILVQQEQASVYIGMIAAAYILIAGITQTIGATTGGSRSKTALYRGLAGIIIGGGILAAVYFGWVNLLSGYTLLAIGLLIYGGLGLWHGFFDRGDIPFSWGPILLNGFLVLWAILIFVARMQDFNLAVISGGILLIIGLIAAVWGFLTRPKGDDDNKAVADNS